jgi:hypothetical protein
MKKCCGILVGVPAAIAASIVAVSPATAADALMINGAGATFP